MKRSMFMVLVLALVFSLVLVPGLMAQAKKDVKTGLDRIEGMVQSIDKDASKLVIRQRGGTNITWQVVYNKDTQFTYRNKPSTLDDVKEGRRVILLGKFGEGNVMTASRIDVREGK